MGKIEFVIVRQSHKRMFDTACGLGYLQDPGTPQIIREEGLEIHKSLFNEELKGPRFGSSGVGGDDG